MSATFRVVVDRDRCSGIGLCESIAPEVFSVGDDGVLSIDDTATDVDYETVTAAVDACPARSLSLVTDVDHDGRRESEVAT